VRDLPSLYARLAVVSEWLEWFGLTHRSYQRPMLQRIAGPASAEELSALTALAQALEPVKDYTREENVAVEPTSQTPMNRVVDAVHLESEPSRRFSVRVDEFLASCKDSAKAAELRSQLMKWAANDGHLQPLVQRSFLVKEASPASAAFSQAAELALGALERITQGLPLTDDLRKQQLAALDAYELQAHKAQLTLPARPALQKLIEAAAVNGTCATPR
jgi:hexosaminidase